MIKDGCKLFKTKMSVVFFFVFSEQDGCNFREFMKTLAHFRQFSKKGQNPLNTEEEKLKCVYESVIILQLSGI